MHCIWGEIIGYLIVNLRTDKNCFYLILRVKRRVRGLSSFKVLVKVKSISAQNFDCSYKYEPKLLILNQVFFLICFLKSYLNHTERLKVLCRDVMGGFYGKRQKITFCQSDKIIE